MKKLNTVKKKIIFKMKYNYKYNLVEFLFNKEFSDFLLHDYFEYYRKNYLTHNKRIKKQGYCIDNGYRDYSCYFCEYLCYNKKIVSKYNFYFDKEIKELLNEFE